MKRGHFARADLDEYTLAEKLCFTTVWSPTWGRGRWRTWAEYLGDFSRLRPALVERYRWGPLADKRPLFADHALAFLEQYGAEALERATPRRSARMTNEDAARGPRECPARASQFGSPNDDERDEMAKGAAVELYGPNGEGLSDVDWRYKQDDEPTH